jgi:uncharacterized protein YbbC (DUF1343 family)
MDKIAHSQALAVLLPALLSLACGPFSSGPDPGPGLAAASTTPMAIAGQPPCAAEPAGAAKAQRAVRTGAQRTDVYLESLRGKRLGLVVNHSSLLGEVHLVDTLLALDLDVRALFAPEHGFRGQADAGALVKDGRDSRSGLPLRSLYGKNKKPSPEQLADLDVLVFDIQDVGARFYTYLSTLHYVMEACAEQGLEVVVLDRPNPNGHYVDGPVLEPAFRSFVGMHPIPVVHGMTLGELARMINGEGWLEGGVKVKLTVVPCEGWSRSQPWTLALPPSPNLKTQRSLYLYPSLCFFEGTVVSLGRGTPWPFEVIGHPGYTKSSFAFTPEPGPGSADPPLKGQRCLGMSFRELPEDSARAWAALHLEPLRQMYRELNMGTAFFLSNGFFDKLAGTDQLRLQLMANQSEEEIRASWQPGIRRFLEQRKPYLLYGE